MTSPNGQSRSGNRLLRIGSVPARQEAASDRLPRCECIAGQGRIPANLKPGTGEQTVRPPTSVARNFPSARRMSHDVDVPDTTRRFAVRPPTLSPSTLHAYGVRP